MAENDNQARTVSESAKDGGLVDVKSLVLLAILLAAGFILNLTIGNALAMTGIKPQFIIAAYALAILLTDAGVGQAALYGVIAACVCQLSTSVPGLNFLSETVAAVIMALLVKTGIGGKRLNPLVATFVTTLVSGALFAVGGTLIAGFALATAVVKVPMVLGTAVFDAVVVQLLAIPLGRVFQK